MSIFQFAVAICLQMLVLFILKNVTISEFILSSLCSTLDVLINMLL